MHSANVGFVYILLTIRHCCFFTPVGRRRVSESKLQVVHFSLDTISSLNESKSATHNITIAFPHGAEKSANTFGQPFKGGLVLDGTDQFGQIHQPPVWLIDLDEAEFGFTVTIQYKLNAKPSKPTYIISTKHRIFDSANVAGLGLMVNSATNELEIQCEKSFRSSYGALPTCNQLHQLYEPSELCGDSQIPTLQHVQTLIDAQVFSKSLKKSCAAKDFCSHSPCNGICLNLPLGYKCLCASGYQWNNVYLQCSTNCTGISCPINTVCANSATGFYCNCDNTHMGPCCEYEKDTCEYNKCAHGRCVVRRQGGSVCNCDPKYMGPRCEQLIVDCSVNPCRNGGTCVNTASRPGFHCACLPRWKGSVCEKAHNACISNYCLNDGYCYLIYGDPKCRCPVTHTGLRCETPVKTCIPNPCLNGGTCVVTDDDQRLYKCVCLSTFTGTVCGEDINECSRNQSLCLQQGQCKNRFGGFRCQCAQSYMSINCSTGIKFCRPETCKQLGSCENLPKYGTFNCQCKKPFVGKRCQIVTAEKCSVISSHRFATVGEYIAYSVACGSLGDYPKVTLDMGDKMIFQALPFQSTNKTVKLTEYVFNATRSSAQISHFEEGSVYLYYHFYNVPGDYIATATIYNRGRRTAQSSIPVTIQTNKNTCFPTVEIVNGGWDPTIGLKIYYYEQFTFESKISLSRECLHYAALYSWQLYNISGEPSLPSQDNAVDLGSYVWKKNNKSIRFINRGEQRLPLGSYMVTVNVTISSLSGNKTFWNIDRGWFKVVTDPATPWIEGGERITLNVDEVESPALRVLQYEEPTPFIPDEEAPAFISPAFIPLYWTQMEGKLSEISNQLRTWDQSGTLRCESEHRNCPQVIESSSEPILHLDSASLVIHNLEPFRPGTSYVFQVIMRAQYESGGVQVDRFHIASQEIKTVSTGFPSVKITCHVIVRSGCQDEVNPNQRLVRTAECLGCQIRYWSVYAIRTSKQPSTRAQHSEDGTGVVFNWESGCMKSRNDTLLIVKPGSLAPGVKYIFQHVGRSADDLQSIASFEVTVNPTPKPGLCIVFPAVGYELDTHFAVQCTNFTDNDPPLIYRFHYHSGNEKSAQTATDKDAPQALGRLLQYSLRPTMNPTMLERGSSGQSYGGVITVIIVDGKGGSTSSKLLLRVLPSPEDIPNSTHWQNDITELLNNSARISDSQGLITLTGTVAVTLNLRQEEKLMLRGKSSKLRRFLVEILDRVPMESIATIEQLAATFAQVVGSMEDLDDGTQVSQMSGGRNGGSVRTPWWLNLPFVRCTKPNPLSLCRKNGPMVLLGQEMGARILATLTDSITQLLLKTELALRLSDSSVYRETAGYLLSAISSLVEAMDLFYQKKEVPQDHHFSENYFATTENVLSLCGFLMVPGDRATLFSTNAMTFAIGKTDIPNLPSYIKNEDALNRYLYLANVNDIDEKMENVIELQAIYSSKQMVTSRKTDELSVNTPNIIITICEVENEGRMADCKDSINLSTDVAVIKIPIRDVPIVNTTKDQKINAFTLPPQAYTSGNITIYRVQIPLEKDLLVWITVRSTPVPLQILAQPTNKPTLDTFSSSTEVVHVAPFTNETALEFAFPFLLSTRSAHESTFFLAVVAGRLEDYTNPAIIKTTDDYSTDDLVNVSMTLTVLCATCVSWHKEESQWVTDGCKVSGRSTPRTLHCDCNHLSVFAGEVFVPPVYPDPATDAPLYLAYFINPIVVVVIVGVWVAYFIVVLAVRKLDNGDHGTKTTQILPSSEPSHNYFYNLTFYTGLRAQAGTSAKVGIILEGDYDKSFPRILNESHDFPGFHSGGEDSFVIATAESLGRLVAVTIWHNGEGSRPFWYIDELIVRDIQTDEIFAFLPKRWLAPHKADGRLLTTVPVATHQDLTAFRYRFSSFVGRGLRDGHLWLSVLFRPPRSNFSRSQRLVCLLSLLLTTALSCLFLYGIPRDPADQRSYFKYGFTWNQVLLGVESGLIALPVNLIVIWLFKSAATYKSEQADFSTLPKQSLWLRSRIAYEVFDPALAHLTTQMNIFEVSNLDAPTFRRGSYFAYVKHRLPLWSAHIAWFIALGGAIACTYYVSLYGLRFGRTKSVEWVMSFLIAVFQSILVTQPLTVVIMAFVAVVVFKSPVEKDNEGRAIIIQPTIHQSILNTSEIIGERKPLSKTWQAALHQIAVLTARMFEWLLDLGLILTFMVCVYVFVHCTFPTGSYRMREELENRFVKLEPLIRMSDMWQFADSLEKLIKDDVHVTRQDKLIKGDVHVTRQNVFKNLTTVPEVDPRNSVASQNYSGPRLYPIGPVRMRNIRIIHRLCPVDHIMAGVGTGCYPKYKTYLRDNGNYEYRWNAIKELTTSEQTTTTPEATTANILFTTLSHTNVSTLESSSTSDESSMTFSHRVRRSVSNAENLDYFSSTSTATTTTVNMSEFYDETTESATTSGFDIKEFAANLTDQGQNATILLYDIWSYKSGTELGISSYAGTLTTYGTGGFVILLQADASSLATSVSFLRSAGWVDYRTKAVIMQCNVYDVNGKYLSVAIQMFEMHGSGVILPSRYVYTIHLLDNYKHTISLVAAGIFSFFFLVLFVYIIVRKIFEQRWIYFGSLWNCLDFTIVILATALFGLFWQSVDLKFAALKQFQNDPSRFSSFYYAVLFENSYHTVAGIFLFLCSMKLLKTLRIGRTVNAFLLVLSELVRPFLGFAAMLVISAMPLIVAGMFLFGHAQQNTGIGNGILSALRLMTAEGDDGRKFKVYAASQYIIGPLYYLMTMICTMFIYSNLLIALIMVIYSTTLKLHKDTIEKEGQLADFVVERMMRMFGVHIRNPVVDIEYFPAVVLFREYLNSAEVLRKRPKGIRLERWSDLVSIKEFRTMMYGAAEDMRELFSDKASADKTERTDFVQNTDEWFLVENIPKRALRGPRTFSVNRMTPLYRGAANTKHLEEIAVQEGLTTFVDESLLVYRKAVEASKKEFDWV
ncbi:uncharacterized protein LOC129586976 isoform X3 [Paramacrobiotus metropolitanus]|uniref:uncharacterized protein LOC129586976 isoform X3 n=1 Tax=Paramacrobiotus metropolitanus TaxID=2943436 RepID=UPI00244601CD|nr:uncharacterized protein LOC129586976 isoform X3 [Paramacrobiotus metropolitanus]